MKKEKNNKIVVTDKAVFFHKIDQNLLRKKQIKFKLKDSKWVITNNNYHRENWRKVFMHMKQSHAENLKLDQNRHPQIIQNIQNVQFIDLKSLILSNNNIDNVQAILFLNCQRIEFLGLSDNNIRSINCLHKLSQPFLQFLAINGNPISQINQISKIYTNKDNWFILYLEYQPNDICVGQDLSIVHKFNFSIPDKVYIMTRKRMIQTKLREIRYYNLVNYIVYM